MVRTIVIARWSEARAPAFFDSDDLSALPRSTIAATMLHAAVGSRGDGRARALARPFEPRARAQVRARVLDASHRIFVREALAALEAGGDSDAQANQKQAQLEAAARVSRLTQLWDMRIEQSATAGIASPRILSRLRLGAASASAPGLEQAPADAALNCAPVRSRLRQLPRRGEGARDDGAEGAPSGRWRKWARLDHPQSASGSASLGYFVVGATNASGSADATATATQPTLAQPAERAPCFYPGLEGDNALRGRIASFMDPPRCYAPIGGLEPGGDAPSERVARESQPESDVDGVDDDDDEGARARQAEDEQLLSLLESQLGEFSRRAVLSLARLFASEPAWGWVRWARSPGIGHHDDGATAASAAPAQRPSASARAAALDIIDDGDADVARGASSRAAVRTAGALSLNRAIDDAERSERLTHREAPADAQEGDASLDGVDISDEWETRDSEHVIIGFYKGLSRRSKPLVSNAPAPGWQVRLRRGVARINGEEHVFGPMRVRLELLASLSEGRAA